MKISWNWLREFVQTRFECADDLAEKLTLHTCEVEEIINTAEKYQGVYTGKLIDVKSHPKSDKLSVAQFDLGKQGIKQGIFGKVHEVEVGEILPIAIAGAVLASGIEIKDTEMAGEKTECMIADNKELGMKNESLIRFPEKTSLGKPLSEAITQAGDFLIDIDNKSLTHRPDLMGHKGFAREMAAFNNAMLLLPEAVVALPEHPKQTVEVDIQSDTCSRFCALKIENVTVEPSDPETMFRLEHLDVRSISNIVDITNLVLMEHGQPMHAFDADKIEGKLIVRQAREGESLVALDGEEYQLCEKDTVVADEKKVLSISGIMGGLESGVTDDTKNIVFECAHWNPTAVRLTSQRLGLRSDSSMRYEKSLDRENCKRAILSATEKLMAACPKAHIVSDLTDNYVLEPEPITVPLHPEKIRAVAGTDISDEFAQDTLEHLGFVVKPNGKVWDVEIPSFRATKDISIEEDLIEEVIRMYGLENIPSQLPTLPIHPAPINKLRQMEWKARDFLSARKYLEIYGYSFANKGEETFTSNDQFVEVQNPLSSEHERLRQTLSYNLIRHIESELRTHRNLDVFELGKVFAPDHQEVLPHQTLRLLICKTTMGGDEDALFYEIKQDFTAFCEQLGLSQIAFQAEEKSAPYLHPYKSAHVMINDQNIGHIGVAHPRFTPTDDSQIALLEIDFEALFALAVQCDPDYQKLNPFPSVHRDLSIVIDKEITMESVVKSARKASSYLERCDLFDDFQDDKKLGAGLKNLAFHLSFRSREGTMGEGVVEEEMEKIAKRLEKECGAQLRIEFDKK